MLCVSAVAGGSYMKMVLLYVYKCCLFPQLLPLHLQVDKILLGVSKLILLSWNITCPSTSVFCEGGIYHPPMFGSNELRLCLVQTDRASRLLPPA